MSNASYSRVIVAVVLGCTAMLSIDGRRVHALGTRLGLDVLASSMFALPAQPERGTSRSWASLIGQRLQTVRDVPYYGATDLVALWRTEDASLRKWFHGSAVPEALAERLSPLTFVRSGLPPVLTLHGDADTTIPYDQAVRLHDALTGRGVPNQLLTVRGGTHGRHTWTDPDTLHAQQAIERFLRRHHILPAALR